MITESLVRLAILMTTLCIILGMFASSFDETEVRTLTLFFLSAAGLEGATGFIKSQKTK